MRFNSLWLGLAMVFSGVQLALHAAHFTDQADFSFGSVNGYILMLDLTNLLTLLSILGGTLASIRARHAGRDALTAHGPAEAAAK